ncbi:MAG: ribosomal RNA small subunit methyltransferase A [Bryobacteraceae bacterium]|nr:ribosomal RNA small subunit methyltransferase A [Bryobacteraceae bacterium]
MGQRLGQHFLHSRPLLERIAEAACPLPCARVIEIGAGEGALTGRLLDRAEHVIAIELDGRLAESLRSRFARETRLTVVQADVLETDLAQWGPAAVAGNLPYYISSPIVDRVLRLGEVVERAALMVQKEVADRLAAQPGVRDYGFLSVATQTRAEVEVLFSVPRGAFRPPPDVDSAVVRLTPRPGLDRREVEDFLHFAGACFRQKRKTLWNNLAPQYGRGRITRFPESDLRAEQLSIDQLRQIYARLAAPPSPPGDPRPPAGV